MVELGATKQKRRSNAANPSGPQRLAASSAKRLVILRQRTTNGGRVDGVASMRKSRMSLRRLRLGKGDGRTTWPEFDSPSTRTAKRNHRYRCLDWPNILVLVAVTNGTVGIRRARGMS